MADVGHPDAILPTKQLGIRQFNNRVAAILKQEGGDAVFDFVVATLAGRIYDEDEAEMYRIYIDALQGLQPGRMRSYGRTLTGSEFQLSRDFDSILGYGDGLPYRQPIAIYSVPPFAEVIKKKVHIMVQCEMGTVSGGSYIGGFCGLISGNVY